MARKKQRITFENYDRPSSNISRQRDSKEDRDQSSSNVVQQRSSEDLDQASSDLSHLIETIALRAVSKHQQEMESKIALLEEKVDNLQQKLDDISGGEQAEQTEQMEQIEQIYIIPAPKDASTKKLREEAIKTLFKNHLEGVTDGVFQHLLISMRMFSTYAHYNLQTSDNKNECKPWDSLSEDEKMSILKYAYEKMSEKEPKLRFLNNCADLWPFEYSLMCTLPNKFKN